MDQYPPLTEISSDPATLAAERAIREYCGWHIAPTVTETLTLDGPGGTLLRLPSMHVIDVAEVVDGGTPMTDPEWSRDGMIRARCWSTRFRGVKVTLDHGYDECPEDLAEVVRIMAAQVPTGQTSKTAGPFMVHLSAAAAAGAVGLSGPHRGILDRYRLSSRP